MNVVGEDGGGEASLPRAQGVGITNGYSGIWKVIVSTEGKREK
jgi:hypothetical protein